MSSRKLRVHIENTRARPEIYHVSAERWDAACARRRALARKLQVTIGWDGNVLEDALRTATIVVGVPARRDSLAARAPGLRWLHATSAGVDGFLPLDWLPRGVTFTNNRGAHGVKAEQYMRMAYTMLHSRLPQIIANQHARRWEQLFSPNIVGRTALILGLGDLGKAAARAARQLGLRVVGVRRTARKSRHADVVHPYSRLDGLLPTADFVVLALPLTPETRQIINREPLELMKRTASVINISRAPVVDYDALADKLQRGELAGAILDVVDPEPLPPDSPLWDVPNLIITPHISCDDGDHYVDISLNLWFENLARFLQNKPLKNRVSAQHGY